MPFTRTSALLRRWVGLCGEAVLPRSCPVCHAPVSGDVESVWCETCGLAMVTATTQEYCTLCGRNTGPYERRDGRCGDCRDVTSPLAAVVRVGPHRQVLRRMILEFKFHRAPTDRLFGRLLAAVIEGAPWRNRIDALVPVPMHWRRRWTRGLHHTRAIARACGSFLSLPVVEVLRRVRCDPPQVGLGKTQRERNVRGAFAPVRGARLTGTTVCLIDDVMTTGATLRETARTLHRAGVADVYAAVLSKSDSTLSA